MCSIKEILIVMLIIVTSCLAKPRSSKSSSDPSTCDPDKLMVYKVSLATHWSRTLFPKQYPEWRPPAQWSKLIGKFLFIYFNKRIDPNFLKLFIGRSHDSNYTLFRLGHSSSDGFKEFTETGRSDALDAQSQGEGGIFDEFNAPAVTSGEGKTEAEFFVDSTHSKVLIIILILIILQSKL